MTEAATVTKARRFPCEACGADIRWDPGVSALKCPYCGTEKVIAVTGHISEKPVDAALRAPRDLGWGAERKVIACKSCGAHTTLEPNISASVCAFCGASAVVEVPADSKLVRPEGLLPFAIPKEKAIQTFQTWISGLWFRPNDLKSKSKISKLQGVYIPFWTFDAATHSRWTAEAGYHYYADVEVVENGHTVTKREQRTRWEPASGFVEKFFDDVPVPASRGIEPELSRGIEPFPTSDIVAYEPSYLSGFLAEENAVDVAEALDRAKERMSAEIRSACSAAVPGDTQRDLAVSTTYSAVAYKNALLPLWIAAYLYLGNPYRFIVNGVTGKAAGTAPWSWVKIGLAVLAVLTVIWLTLTFTHH